MRPGTRRRTCGTVAASGINGERRNRNSRVAGPPYGLGERRKFDLAQRKTRSRRPATHVGAPGPSGQRRGLLCRVRGGRRRRRRAQCRLRRDLGIRGRRRGGVAGKAHHGPNNSGRVGSQSAPETRRHRNPRASLLARGLSVVVNTLTPTSWCLAAGWPMWTSFMMIFHQGSLKKRSRRASIRLSCARCTATRAAYAAPLGSGDDHHAISSWS